MTALVKLAWIYKLQAAQWLDRIVPKVDSKIVINEVFTNGSHD